MKNPGSLVEPFEKLSTSCGMSLVIVIQRSQTDDGETLVMGINWRKKNLVVKQIWNHFVERGLSLSDAL